MSSFSSCSSSTFEHAFAAWALRSEHNRQSEQNLSSSSSCDVLRLESAVMEDELCNLNLKFADCHFLLTCPTGKSENVYFMELLNDNELNGMRVTDIQDALASINEYAMERSHLELATMLDKIHSYLVKVVSCHKPEPSQTQPSGAADSKMLTTEAEPNNSVNSSKKRKIDIQPVVLDTQKRKQQKKVTEKDLPSNFAPPTSAATRCLMKNLQQAQHADSKANGYEVSVDPENLYLWKVKLFGFPEEEPIGADMKRSGVDHILMHMRFSGEFPFVPPRCNIIRPRMKKQTGHVVEGGAFCMELLTQAGWSPAYTVDAVIVQIRATLLDGKARLDLSNKNDYQEWRAVKGHDRMEEFHEHFGWGRQAKE